MTRTANKLSGGTVHDLHLMAKVTIFPVLSLIVFLTDPRKIVLFGSMILLLLFISKDVFIKNPIFFIIIAFFVVGQAVFGFTTGGEIVAWITETIKYVLLIGTGLLAGDAFTDYEIYSIASLLSLESREFGPVSIGSVNLGPVFFGAAVGLQRTANVYYDIKNAHTSRGFLAGFSPTKTAVLLISRLYSFSVRMLRLNENIYHQYTLRGYDQMGPRQLLDDEFELKDYLSILLSLTLFILAIVPWGTIPITKILMIMEYV